MSATLDGSTGNLVSLSKSSYYDYESVVSNDIFFTGNKTTYLYDLIHLGEKKVVIGSEKDKFGLNTRLNFVDEIPTDYDVKLLKRVK